MRENPDHKIIKSLAENLLLGMTTTPVGLQRVCAELMPIADFHNGLTRPNNRPPSSVRIILDGQMWIFNAHKRRWRTQ